MPAAHSGRTLSVATGSRETGFSKSALYELLCAGILYQIPRVPGGERGLAQHVE